MNITGSMKQMVVHGYNRNTNIATGAFSTVVEAENYLPSTASENSDKMTFNFDASKSWPGNTSDVGISAAHNNLNPYITVYIFRRTN